MIVGHCRTKFLPISEVFIENQIFELENVKPIVLTCELENAHLTHEIKIFSFCDDRRTFHRTFYGTFFRLIKKMPKREGEYFGNVIRENKIQLLHVHFGTDAWYFMKLKKLANIPMVVSFYGYDAYKFPKMFFGIGKILLKQVFKVADAIIVPSLHMKEHLVGLGCDVSKIQVIPWGTEPITHPKSFDGTSNSELITHDERYMKRNIEHEIHSIRHTGSVRFISLGRMVEKKGQIYLLEAFKRVLDSGVNAELTIIGQGPLRNKLVGAIDKFGISAKVNLIDKLLNSEVMQVLMSHNIYVQPSVVSRNGDQEGIPTAIMEAFACELPIIATKHAGIPEIVENNVSGILVPERDSEKLAEAMIKLAKDTELCKQFGVNGKKIVNEKYNVNKQNKKLCELYEREIDRFNSNI